MNQNNLILKDINREESSKGDSSGLEIDYEQLQKENEIELEETLSLGEIKNNLTISRSW